jgi:septum formation protein
MTENGCLGAGSPGMMEASQRPPLILASASPRRREILRQLGLPFRIMVPDVDEDAIRADSPADLALRRAVAKAAAVDWPGGLVLAADTLVAMGGRIYGKPRDAADAEAMLAALCGRQHEVWSGLCLACGGRRWSEAVRTRVWLRAAEPAALAAYVATGEPLDKAGAYAAQGRGALLVERVDGCFWNVVGLPVSALVEGLRVFGYGVWPCVARPPGNGDLP